MICFIIRGSGVSSATTPRPRAALSDNWFVIPEELPCCPSSVRSSPTLRCCSSICSGRLFISGAVAVRSAGFDKSFAGVYGGKRSKFVSLIVTVAGGSLRRKRRKKSSRDNPFLRRIIANERMSITMIAIMIAATSPLMEARDRDIFVEFLSEISVLDGFADMEVAVDIAVAAASVIEVEVEADIVLVTLSMSISTLNRERFQGHHQKVIIKPTCSISSRRAL